MEVQIEKPFQCTTCLARFTNEDHLQVHKKRHEMSLNLGGPKCLEDGFVDQTPTPTHLCRSLEDVGLFQDLQNINPFDAQFSKATPSEIHNDTAFQFNFSFPRTDSHPHAPTTPTNNDTLNTPQIPGFSPTTPLPHHDKSPKKVLTPSQETQEALGSGSTAPRPNEQKIAEPSVPKPSIPPKSPPTSTQLPPPPTVISIESTHPFTDTDATSPSIAPQRKSEMLERNRAAASRSRERRKQWVSSLEAKCAALQAELSRTRAENRLMREEIIRHIPNSYLLKPLFPPSIMGSSPSPTLITPIHVRSARKRGRPRKGQELPVSTLPELQPTPLPLPPKIQILPLSAIRTTTSISPVPVQHPAHFLLLQPSDPS